MLDLIIFRFQTRRVSHLSLAFLCEDYFGCGESYRWVSSDRFRRGKDNFEWLLGSRQF